MGSNMCIIICFILFLSIHCRPFGCSQCWQPLALWLRPPFSVAAATEAKLTTRTAYVVPISDNGGSSKEIIRVLGVIWLIFFFLWIVWSTALQIKMATFVQYRHRTVVITPVCTGIPKTLWVVGGGSDPPRPCRISRGSDFKVKIFFAQCHDGWGEVEPPTPFLSL